MAAAAAHIGISRTCGGFVTRPQYAPRKRREASVSQPASQSAHQLINRIHPFINRSIKNMAGKEHVRRVESTGWLPHAHGPRRRSRAWPGRSRSPAWPPARASSPEIAAAQHPTLGSTAASAFSAPPPPGLRVNLASIDHQLALIVAARGDSDRKRTRVFTPDIFVPPVASMLFPGEQLLLSSAPSPFTLDARAVLLEVTPSPPILSASWASWAARLACSSASVGMGASCIRCRGGVVAGGVLSAPATATASATTRWESCVSMKPTKSSAVLAAAASAAAAARV